MPLTRSLRAALASLAALAATLGSAPAGAAVERDARGSAAPSSEPVRKSEPTSEEREVPDYDGRGDEPTTAGDVALWVPRILLFPPYLVSEYVLRRPLGWAIAGAERAGLPAYVYDLFTFGPNHNAGFFPTAYFDFGFRTSVGLYTFWNDAFVPGHDLVLRGSTGGKDWLTATFSERFRFGPGRSSSFTLEASGLSRPDYMYYGLGPDTRKGDLLRYGQDRLQGRLVLEQRPTTATLLRSELMLRTVEFRPGGFSDDARLSDAVAAGLTPPPGYTRGYTLVRSELTATYDERKLRPARAAGVFGGVRGSLNSELRAQQSFVTYGAKLGAFVDVNQRGRVVSLAATTRFADPLDGGEIPFTELVTLGGLEPMRGFYAGRLADRSAAVAELAYRWPIWIWLNGAMRAEVGNVFGEHLQGFDAGKLRWSGTIGVESTNPAETGFELLFGVGSETFESGGKVDSIRFVIGTTNGL